MLRRPRQGLVSRPSRTIPTLPSGPARRQRHIRSIACPLPAYVEHAKVELGGGMPLLGSLAHPYGRFRVAFRDTRARQEQQADVELRQHMPIARGLQVPPRCLSVPPDPMRPPWPVARKPDWALFSRRVRTRVGSGRSRLRNVPLR